MKEYVIFTDGDVDLPSPYEKEVSLLPQYYYFDENMIYGDEQVLSREAFFEQLRSRRAYTAGVNPDFTRRRFEEVLGAGKDVLCIAVSSALSGSYSTICMVADELRPLYPESRIEVIDSLSATLGSGFLCVDAIELRGRGLPLAETADEIRRRVGLIDVYFVVDDFKYLVQGGRVSPSVGKIGDILDIKVTLTITEGRIVPYKKNRGINAALRNIQQISQSRETARLGSIYVGNQALFEKCRSLVQSDCQASLNLIVASHVGPNTTGIAIEWAQKA
ncbi:DegV family protein [uncultured Acetatifactor sp.]|uniref:DegV family protein n=1 Tax=uncultured Acetatifactor sp. TaxID=1671927 RepID=UPI0025D73A47|nr:DegV family protein [uncultured Acetatifactor sp.]MCI9230732.1 DegV family protein [Lachnospiraceae bacterium]MCI9573813.1 DegV family protein [Lachnospiraceae bacterium]